MDSYIRLPPFRSRQPRLRVCLVAASALVLLAVVPAVAAAVPTGFQEQTAFSGLTGPTAVAFAPDGRAFVSEKSGLIKEFDSLSDGTATTTADLRTDVYNFWDRGLLSIALDPQFPTRPYLYALYSRDALPGGSAPRWGTAGQTGDPCPDPPGATTDGCVVTGRLVRLTLSGNVATAQTTLITDWCQQYPSHSIGDLVFGPDGALYVSGGDGASFTFADWGQDGSPVNPCGDPPGPAVAMTPPLAEGGSLRSQDARTTTDPTGLDGTILRINPDTGAAMAGNPFASSSDANQRRIVAYGLRNPFRFTFRPGTSEIWAGDVGQDTWEEINRVLAPADSSADNFGWPCYEGSARQPGYDAANLSLCETLYVGGTAIAPYYAYNHGDHVVNGESCSNGSSAISGVAFYPGGDFPDAYDGALFFEDYGRKCIWAMLPGTNGRPDPTKIQVFDAGALNPVNLINGASGDLFYANLGASSGGSADGSIQRIFFPHQNSAPVARATATPSSGAAPLQVSLSASGSSDPDGDALSFAWDLNENGTFETPGASVSKTYATPGTYHPTVRVSDPDGASDTAAVTVNAGNTAPSAHIDAPADASSWAVGDAIQFSGSATDAQQTVADSGYSWNVIIRHCPDPNDPSDCHSHPFQRFDGVASGSFSAPDHEYPSYLELQLTVTDSGGLTGTDSVRLDPRPVELAISSTPPGLEVGIDQAVETTPFNETVIENSQHSIAAPETADVGGETYYFNSWSDGGAAAHTITTSGDTDLGVTYSPDEPPPPLNPLLPLVLGDSAESCTGRSATIVGTKGNDRLSGTKRADVIVGLGGRDVLIGKGGNDRLCGGTGVDMLEGGRGSDRCVGGPGRDHASRCDRSKDL